MYLSKPTDCTKQNETMVFVTVVVQFKFTDYNKYTTMAQDVDNQGNCACMEAGDI